MITGSKKWLNLSPSDRFIVEEFVHRVSGEPLVRRIILFGSKARGESTRDSDFDFVVLGDFTDPSWPNRMSDLKARLGNLRTVGIDLLPLTEWELDNKFFFRDAVYQEGIVVYEK
ncbi:nucleotidyltransferase domain-containing protein [Paenibacillus sp. IB182496]|uniref:Nucleotidyltransferase domain-containing protein n=1 Tax=Paenibacillus sabuli TaxID=2772509 RepID=A0A927BZ40_9BACL|nr:nucleotidyltransferase domain-containing protein [Paenibacillus sabuli]MBD2848149.1 nucleotidyltransferase domain-containing protein [Paenibacillus sabuli]